jgi:hypothetical protein
MSLRSGGEVLESSKRSSHGTKEIRQGAGAETGDAESECSSDFSSDFSSDGEAGNVGVFNGPLQVGQQSFLMLHRWKQPIQICSLLEALKDDQNEAGMPSVERW